MSPTSFIALRPELNSTPLTAKIHETEHAVDGAPPIQFCDREWSEGDLVLKGEDDDQEYEVACQISDPRGSDRAYLGLCGEDGEQTELQCTQPTSQQPICSKGKTFQHVPNSECNSAKLEKISSIPQLANLQKQIRTIAKRVKEHGQVVTDVMVGANQVLWKTWGKMTAEVLAKMQDPANTAESLAKKAKSEAIQIEQQVAVLNKAVTASAVTALQQRSIEYANAAEVAAGELQETVNLLRACAEAAKSGGNVSCATSQEVTKVKNRLEEPLLPVMAAAELRDTTDPTVLLETLSTRASELQKAAEEMDAKATELAKAVATAITNKDISDETKQKLLNSAKSASEVAGSASGVSWRVGSGLWPIRHLITTLVQM